MTIISGLIDKEKDCKHPHNHIRQALHLKKNCFCLPYFLKVWSTLPAWPRQTIRCPACCRCRGSSCRSGRSRSCPRAERSSATAASSPSLCCCGWVKSATTTIIIVPIIRQSTLFTVLHSGPGGWGDYGGDIKAKLFFVLGEGLAFSVSIILPPVSLYKTHSHACRHTHARTHARTHACTHTHTHQPYPAALSSSDTCDVWQRPLVDGWLADPCRSSPGLRTWQTQSAWVCRTEALQTKK